MVQPGEGVKWWCLLSKRCIVFTCLEIDPTNYSLLQLKVYIQGIHCSIAYNSKSRSHSRGLIKYIIRQPYHGVWAAILKGSGVVATIYKVRWRMMHNILPLDFFKKKECGETTDTLMLSYASSFSQGQGEDSLVHRILTHIA